MRAPLLVAPCDVLASEWVLILWIPYEDMCRQDTIKGVIRRQGPMFSTQRQRPKGCTEKPLNKAFVYWSESKHRTTPRQLLVPTCTLEMRSSEMLALSDGFAPWEEDKEMEEVVVVEEEGMV